MEPESLLSSSKMLLLITSRALLSKVEFEKVKVGSDFLESPSEAEMRGGLCFGPQTKLLLLCPVRSKILITLNPPPRLLLS